MGFEVLPQQSMHIYSAARDSLEPFACKLIDRVHLAYDHFILMEQLVQDVLSRNPDLVASPQD